MQFAKWVIPNLDLIYVYIYLYIYNKPNINSKSKSIQLQLFKDYYIMYPLYCVFI